MIEFPDMSVAMFQGYLTRSRSKGFTGLSKKEIKEVERLNTRLIASDVFERAGTFYENLTLTEDDE